MKTIPVPTDLFNDLTEAAGFAFTAAFARKVAAEKEKRTEDECGLRSLVFRYGHAADKAKELRQAKMRAS